MHALAAHDIPHTLLHFPRLALDADYAWVKLRFLMPKVARPAFGEVFRRLSRPELIHRFGEAPAQDPSRGAEAFLQGERRKRRRRRVKRLVLATAIAAAAVLAARILVERTREPPAAETRASGAGH